MKATFYELGRYMVSSETGKDEYLVDLLEPKCDCHDFRIRVDARKEKPECKHIPVAFEQFGRDQVEEIKKLLPKPKKNLPEAPTKLRFRQ